MFYCKCGNFNAGVVFAYFAITLNAQKNWSNLQKSNNIDVKYKGMVDVQFPHLKTL